MTDADVSRPEPPSTFSLVLNVWPALHLAGGAALALGLADGAAARAGVFALWLYLLPPLAARALIALFGRPEGRLTQDMRSYRVWWALTQLQMVFNRFPALEEALRLAPGLYAAWIALWGGRISARAFIGPRVVVTDRYAISVESGAVLGFSGALAGHMALREADGRWVVVAAGPHVEAGAILGGGAGLGPGAVLARGALLPAGRRVGPFVRHPREARRETTP
jgi:hypothetical protein